MRLRGKSIVKTLGILAAFVLTISLAAPPAQAQPLKKILRASATKIISPLEINFIVPTVLDYYKQEGLEVELLPLGSNAAVLAATRTPNKTCSITREHQR